MCGINTPRSDEYNVCYKTRTPFGSANAWECRLDTRTSDSDESSPLATIAPFLVGPPMRAVVSVSNPLALLTKGMLQHVDLYSGDPARLFPGIAIQFDWLFLWMD